MSTITILNDHPIEMGPPCIHCGYDLRGLDHAARCPECGRWVRHSLGTTRIEDANLLWVKKIRHGLTVLALGVTFPVFGYLALIGAAGISVELFDRPLDRWFPIAREGIRMVAVLLVVIGSVLITSLEPRDALRESSWSMRSFARVAAGLVGLLTLVSPSLQRWIEPLALTVSFELSGLVLVVSGLTHLARLASRLPDTRLEGAATVIQWGLSISILGHILIQHVPALFGSGQGGLAGLPPGIGKVLSMLSWTGMAIFGLYLAVILNRFLRAFGSNVGRVCGPTTGLATS